MSALSFRQWLTCNKQRTFKPYEHLPRILLLDGGVSTHLEELIPFPFPYRELWSSSLLLSDEGRKNILQGHTDWLTAGSNAISSVTYQCHYETQFYPRLEDGTLLSTEQMDQMWKDGIQLAEEAIKKHTSSLERRKNGSFVVASSGCYGAAMAGGQEYTGDYNGAGIEDLIRFHQRKLNVVVPLRPDGIALETIPSVAECKALQRLLCSGDPQQNPLLKSNNSIACYAALACRDESHLNDGTDLEKALDVLLHIPVDRLHAVGFNCCNTEHVPGLLKTLVKALAESKERTSKNETLEQRGIVLYPNSGETWDASSETWKEGSGYRDSSTFSGQLLSCVELIESLWQELRPSNDPLPSILVGGCCRTTPSTIQALRKVVDKHMQKEASHH